jgi:hypothetical protein
MNGFESRARDLSVGSTTDTVWSGALLVASPVGAGSIERRLMKITGANARDCGRHDITVSEAALQVSLQCASASALAKEPFSVVVQTTHEGHLAGFGLLGYADGSMHVFRYYKGGLAFDSKPCPSSPSTVRAGPSGPPFAFECQP